MKHYLLIYKYICACSVIIKAFTLVRDRVFDCWRFSKIQKYYAKYVKNYKLMYLAGQNVRMKNVIYIFVIIKIAKDTKRATKKINV